MRTFKLLSTLIFCMLLPAAVIFAEETYWPLDGNWFNNGKSVTVQRSEGSNNFIFCNEMNNCANGFMDRRYHIIVPRWHLSGNVLNNGNAINWSNGTSWIRNNFSY